MKCFKYIMLITLVLLTISCGKKEESLNLKEYEANVICTLDYQDEVDGMLINSTNKVFINYDDKMLVNNALYQTTTDEYSINMYERLVNIFNEINGISADLYIVDNKLVVEIEYNYDMINIDEVKDKLGILLDEEALLNKVDKLPITYDEFIDLELKEYKCEVQ